MVSRAVNFLATFSRKKKKCCQSWQQTRSEVENVAKGGSHRAGLARLAIAESRCGFYQVSIAYSWQMPTCVSARVALG